MGTEEELAVQALTQEEIENLNASGTGTGRRLKPDGYYLKVFVINDKQNRAADPIPFKVAKRSLEKIVNTIVGRPFVVGPNPKKHVRGAMGAASTAEDIIKAQQKWAIGEFVRPMMNQLSMNAYGIVEVFKEFVDDVKNGVIRGKPMPRYTSPLLEARKIDPETGEIIDGRLLHVQAVDVPGYGEVAKIVGTCEGMLDECSNKLRALGASGGLKAFQESLQKSDNSLSSGDGNYDSEPPMEKGKNEQELVPLTKQDLPEIVSAVLSGLEQKYPNLGAAGAASAQAQQQVEPKEKGKAANPMTAPKAKGDAEGTGAQEADNDNDENSLRAELEDLKAKFEEEQEARKKAEERLQEQERKQIATRIVELEMQLHITSPSKKKDRIEQLMKRKDKSGAPADLSLILETLERSKEKTLGAAGFGDDEGIAGLRLGASGDEDDVEPNYAEIFRNVRRAAY